MAGGIAFYNFCATQQSVNPGTVGANTSVEVAVSLPGLLIGDIVVCSIKPSLSAGLDVGQARVTGNGAVNLLFQNSTAAGITPGTQTYLFVIMRPENAPGTADGLTNGAVIFK